MNMILSYIVKCLSEVHKTRKYNAYLNYNQRYKFLRNQSCTTCNSINTLDSYHAYWFLNATDL